MGKLFKALVAAAAVGSVCYVFKDKIKATKAYQTLGVDEKVEKVKTTIKDKMPIKDDTERDYFTLNDADQATDDAEEAVDASEEAVTEAAAEVEEAAAEVEDAVKEASAPSVTAVNDETSASDVSAMVDNLLSDIPEMSIGSEDMGLSDVSEDVDVLAEQDKLDI